MKPNLKISLAKIKSDITQVKKLLWIIARHAFTVILVLILIDIVIGGIIYYKYLYLPKKDTTGTSSIVFKFKDDIYNKILTQWDERDKKLQDFMLKNYANPF